MRTLSPIRSAADPTEAFRRIRLSQINPGVERAELERLHGTVWDPAQLVASFEVINFLAPYVIVRRKSDGRIGSLEFQHEPRLYFNWREDK